jgi:hypothetical protein
MENEENCTGTSNWTSLNTSPNSTICCGGNEQQDELKELKLKKAVIEVFYCIIFLGDKIICDVKFCVLFKRFLCLK